MHGSPDSHDPARGQERLAPASQEEEDEEEADESHVQKAKDVEARRALLDRMVTNFVKRNALPEVWTEALGLLPEDALVLILREG